MPDVQGPRNVQIPITKLTPPLGHCSLGLPWVLVIGASLGFGHWGFLGH